MRRVDIERRKFLKQSARWVAGIAAAVAGLGALGEYRIKSLDEANFTQAAANLGQIGLGRNGTNEVYERIKTLDWLFARIDGYSTQAQGPPSLEPPRGYTPRIVKTTGGLREVMALGYGQSEGRKIISNTAAANVGSFLKKGLDTINHEHLEITPKGLFPLLLYGIANSHPEDKSAQIGLARVFKSTGTIIIAHDDNRVYIGFPDNTFIVRMESYLAPVYKRSRLKRLPESAPLSELLENSDHRANLRDTFLGIFEEESKSTAQALTEFQQILRSSVLPRSVAQDPGFDQFLSHPDAFMILQNPYNRQWSRLGVRRNPVIRLALPTGEIRFA